MKIEFIKDHSFFNAKSGDVREDISQAAMLVGAGYAKMVDSEDEEASQDEPAAKKAKAPKNLTTESAEEKAEEADVKDKAKS